MSVLGDEQLTAALRRLPGWRFRQDKIRREYRFSTFVAAIAFVNRVAELAESARHHPEINIRYDRVMISLVTHDDGGVTEKDLHLASRLDATFLQ